MALLGKGGARVAAAALGVFFSPVFAIGAIAGNCSADIVVGGELCDPGVFNAVEKPFDLYAKLRRFKVSGATTANGLPQQFNAYVFDFNGNPDSGPLTPPVFHVPAVRPNDKTAAPKSLGVMRFDLHNELPEVWNETFMVNNLIPAGFQPLNIHTHGLLASPHGADAEGRYGDYVGVIGCPEATRPSCPANPDFMQMTEICGMARSAAEGRACAGGHVHGAATGAGPISMHGLEVLFKPIPYSIEIPGGHPAGLDWFHPHVHELASPQVGAGLAGVITVGSLCSNPALSQASADEICEEKGGDAVLKDNIRERFFLLKDLQVFDWRPGGQPAAGENLASAEGYRVIPQCNPASGAAPGILPEGYCRFDAPDSTAPAGTWLFTVNGQIEPQVTMQAGRPEIWRFANLSSNATYKLSLCKSHPLPDPTDAALSICADADQKPFEILSLDGGLSPGENLKDEHEILLAPGARAEIIVKPEAGERFTLVQKGFHAPDLYPPVFLASVASVASVASEAGTAKAPKITLASREARARVASKALASKAAPASFEKPEDCEKKPDDLSTRDWLSLSGGEALVSVFFGRTWDHPEILTIGMMEGNPEESSDPKVQNAIRKCLQDGDADAEDCKFFHGTEFKMERRNLCLRHGMKVTFRLYNLTDETHNFHIHQQKFAVATSGQTIAYSTPSNAASIRSQIQRGQQLVDSVPLPSVWADKTTKPIALNPPIEVTMNFDKPEQVGDFVFHCHILEHEDKGMMKRVTVYTEDRR